MPQELMRRAAAIAAGDAAWEIPEARPAATVVLLRETTTGISTYLMRRTPTMAFAAGMHVFPGGRIDAADFDSAVEVRGEIPAPRMTADDRLGRALVIGAVREVFEETGVLLAVDAAGRWPELDDQWDADRLIVEQDSTQLAGVLARRGLHIEAEHLPLWSHWITPEVEERRYDVRFFAAVVPPNHPVRDVSGEADQVRWVTPSEGLVEYDRGQLAMLPPTVTTLRELIALDSVAGLLPHSVERPVQPLLPRARLGDDGQLIWEIINATTGAVVSLMSGAPAGSESRGIHS